MCGVLVYRNENQKTGVNQVLPAKIVIEDDIYRGISSSEAKKLIDDNLQNGSFHIIDVRTKDEYEQGHIKGAVNLDFYQNDFDGEIKNLSRNDKYLIYCKTGPRSEKALEIFKNNQFKEVYYLLGGYTEFVF